MLTILSALAGFCVVLAGCVLADIMSRKTRNLIFAYGWFAVGVLIVGAGFRIIVLAIDNYDILSAPWFR